MRERAVISPIIAADMTPIICITVDSIRSVGQFMRKCEEPPTVVRESHLCHCLNKVLDVALSVCVAVIRMTRIIVYVTHIPVTVIVIVLIVVAVVVVVVYAAAVRHGDSQHSHVLARYVDDDVGADVNTAVVAVVQVKLLLFVQLLLLGLFLFFYFVDAAERDVQVGVQRGRVDGLQQLLRHNKLQSIISQH